MGSSKRLRRLAWAACLSIAASLVSAVGAQGALPVAGKLYTGHTSASYNNFTAPVSFTVAKSARQLHAFTWAGGCFGGGPGTIYANRGANYKLPTIAVAKNGSFQAKNVRTSAAGKLTISTLSGRFLSATKATGTISYRQRVSQWCAGKVRFTALLGPAPGQLQKLTPAQGAGGQPQTPTLSWSASRNATAYEYCVTQNANGRCSGSWVSTASTHAALSGLSAGSTYYWQVLATSAHGTVAADQGAWYSFTVASATSPGGGQPPTTVTPRAGTWMTSGNLNINGSVSAGHATITGLSFAVTPDQANVSSFGLDYRFEGFTKPLPNTSLCFGTGLSVESPPAPIVNAQFSTPERGSWTGAAGATFSGTFDSATTAHGSAQASVLISGLGCQIEGWSQTATFTWTATWQGS
jgi:hypothetical protein